MTTQSSPSPHRRRPGIFRRLGRAAWRAFAWTLAGIIGLALATTITLLFGYIVYVAQGRPNSYEDRMAANEIQRALYSGPTMIAGTTVAFAGIQVGLPRASLFVRTTEWESPRPAELVHSSGLGGVYRVDDAGIVTRIHLIRRGLPENVIDSLATRLRSTWMTPSAVAAPIEESTTVFETTVWRSNRHIMIVEFAPAGRHHYDLLVTVIDSRDPLFKTRWETGGLNPAHRHAKKIAEQLAK